MVRQFEQPNKFDLLFLLDLWRPDRPTAAERANVELAVSFAATVWTDLCRRGAGSRLVLGIGGDEILVCQGAASRRTQMEAWEALAICRPTSGRRLEDLQSTILASHAAAVPNRMLVTTRPMPTDASQAAGRDDSPTGHFSGRVLHVDSDEFRGLFFLEQPASIANQDGKAVN